VNVVGHVGEEKVTPSQKTVQRRSAGGRDYFLEAFCAR
jgi:hypothetical protein